MAVVVVIGVLATRSSTSSDSAKTDPVASNLVLAGDLGPLDSEQALRTKVEPALSGGGARPTGTEPTEVAGCVGVARKLQPQGAALAYVATTRWQGTDAEVFGFNPPGVPATSSAGRPARTRMYVLARSDCHLLVFQSFSP